MFRIDDAIFERFPGLTIGVVIASGIDNHRHSDRAAALLRQQVEIARAEWSHKRLESAPGIAVWREAYRAFGAKPKKHRCSVESLIRTILDGADVPSINPVVDAYNAISLKHCIPVGGDDLDKVIGDIRLTLASGDERFVPLNGSESTSPRPGEVVYRDDEDVLCRRWNWRECDKSKMTENTTNVCLVIEGLPPVTGDKVRCIADQLSGLIETHCGGSCAAHFVDHACPQMAIQSRSTKDLHLSH